MSVAVADKRWWGPRIWRVLHAMAEIADRTDCVAGWRTVLRLTAQILPCDICREHFSTASRALSLPLPGSGKTPRDALRHFLWATHGSATGATAAEPFPESALSATYGCSGDRGRIVTEVRAAVTEIASAFRSAGILDRFRIGYLEEWVRAVQSLISLLAVPELVMVRRRPLPPQAAPVPRPVPRNKMRR